MCLDPVEQVGGASASNAAGPVEGGRVDVDVNPQENAGEAEPVASDDGGEPEGRQPEHRKGPRQPTAEEMRIHKATHCPYRV